MVKNSNNNNNNTNSNNNNKKETYKNATKIGKRTRPRAVGQNEHTRELIMAPERRHTNPTTKTGVAYDNCPLANTRYINSTRGTSKAAATTTKHAGLV